jgi:putative NADH-flavin reductase
MEPQSIVLFGATTKVGQSILNEALDRGHKVTAIVSAPEKISKSHNNLTIVKGEIVNKNDIGSKIKGHDVVISAYDVKSEPADHLRFTNNLISAVNSDEIRHLIVLGHPGTEEMESSIPLPANLEAWKAVAETQRKTREALEDTTSKFRWSYVHYPEIEGAFGKSGKPVIGNKVLIKNPESEQWVTIKDCSQAVLDEAEHFTEAHTEL